MRRLLIACALVLTATPQAHADEPVSYASRVRECVAAASGDKAALEACQGVASHPCMDEPFGVTTHGMVTCLSDEGAAWEALMEAAASRLSSARPETAAALAAAQTNWRAFRDAECSYRVVRWGEGTGARVELAGCMAGLAADRAIVLIVLEQD